MSGPRDWSPSGAGSGNVMAFHRGRGRGRGRRRGGGSFARAVFSSLLVVPVGISAWVFLWQFGLMSSIVGWLIAILAIVLFRWGSGGVISGRGVAVLAVIISVTLVVGLASAYLFDAARQFFPEASVPIGVVAEAVGNLEYWSSVRRGFEGQWSGTVWLTVLSGLVLGAAGFVPTLVRAAGGRSRVLAVALPLAGLAVIIAVTVVGHLIVLPTEADLPVSQSGLAAGDCINTVSEPDGVIDEYQAGIPLVPCDGPHWAEVVYVGSTPGREGSSGYPGGPWLSLEAQEQCQDAYAEYVGTPTGQSALARQVYFPTASGWDSGDRDVVCAVYDPATPTTGTLRGSAR